MIEPKGVVHFSIAVSDLDASQRFYTELLGLTLVHAAPQSVWCFYAQGTTTLFSPRAMGPCNVIPKIADGRITH
jgi:catechol 2,3-dioxygenase-like lactoylglutathione lyase family enzyme